MRRRINTRSFWKSSRNIRDRPDALDKLYVRSAKGQLVPLDEVASVARTVGPLSVNHFGQIPAATVSFNLQPGFAGSGCATT